LEDEFQTLLAARLAELSALPAPAARSDGRLAFGPDRLDRLNERARHMQKDYGSRRATVAAGPSYEVVYLLTREPDRYPGFRVRPTREREAAPHLGEGSIPAAELLGVVSGVSAEQVQRQRSDAVGLRTRHAIDEPGGEVEPVLIGQQRAELRRDASLASRHARRLGEPSSRCGDSVVGQIVPDRRIRHLTGDSHDLWVRHAVLLRGPT
jgi:hypothetical protein